MANTPGKASYLKLSISSVFTTLGQLVSVQPPQMSMGTVETTTLSSTWRTFIATVLDGGEVTCTVNYDASDSSHAQLWTDFQAGTVDSWKIVFADTGAAEVAFSGIITALEWGEYTIDDLVQLNITIKVTSTVTITP